MWRVTNFGSNLAFWDNQDSKAGNKNIDFQINFTRKLKLLIETSKKGFKSAVVENQESEKVKTSKKIQVSLF